MRTSTKLLVGLVGIALATACGGDDDAPSSSVDAPPVPTDSTTVDSTTGTIGTTPASGMADIVAGEPIPDARCEANRAAGTITAHLGDAPQFEDGKWAIQMPHFSTIATTRMMTMQYKDTPLDEDVAQNTKLFSVLNMLIADENDAAYSETIGHTTNTDLEEALGTTSSKL